MEEFPANSQRPVKTSDEIVGDIRKSQNRTRDQKVTPTTDSKKKVERVTTGEVVRRKKPLGKRFKEIFVSGDGRSVMSYIALDVLVPAAKDTIADAVGEGVQRMLFGEGSGRRRDRGRSGSYVSYNRMSSSGSPFGVRSNRDDDRREMSRRGRASHDFDELVLPTRGEAEEVIDRLFDLISRYESASVADLYELVGINSNYTDNKWGWTDFRGAGVSRVRNGYLLDLPRAEPLD